MRHTNIWESERKSCTFEKNQLKDMILVWQKDFLQLKTSDINLALGIYGGMYFDNPFWGGAAFRGSINEQIISIIKPTALDNSDSFQIVRGLDDDNPHTILHYDVIGKLWSGPDRNQMFSIEDDLIEEIFDFMIRDFSKYALNIYSKPSNSSKQKELSLNMIKAPIPNIERFEKIFTEHVYSLKNQYKLND